MLWSAWDPLQPPISFRKPLVLLRNIWKQSHAMPGGQEEQGMNFFGFLLFQPGQGIWVAEQGGEEQVNAVFLATCHRPKALQGPTSPRGTRSAQTACQ